MGCGASAPAAAPAPGGPASAEGSSAEVAALDGVYSNRKEMSRVDLGIDFKTFLGKSDLKVHQRT